MTEQKLPQNQTDSAQRDSRYAPFRDPLGGFTVEERQVEEHGAQLAEVQADDV